MKREQLGSRMGFIMLSAGCAIGCGNVWKFPWMCGQNGGGSFMLGLSSVPYRTRHTCTDNGIFHRTCSSGQSALHVPQT